MVTHEVETALRIAIAALGGAAIGIERQWSGHATGPHARFGGIRTFTLLGVLAGIAGVCLTLQAMPVAAALVAGGAAIVAGAYWKMDRKDVEATTEVAALVVIAAGVLAGAGQLVLSSGIIAVSTLLLIEKSRLHAAVAHLDRAEVQAAAQFLVMAVVILPLLPAGPFGPLGGIHPRQLWILVLFFSGLSFVGFLARRIVGQRHGYVVAGLLGGMVSSTSVAFTYARASHDDPQSGRQLAYGVLAACTVMYLRILIATGVLNTDLMTALLPYLGPPLLVTAGVTVFGLKRGGAAPANIPEPQNPLQLKRALQMALLFQAVLFAVHAVRDVWGGAGLLVSGAILGLTDMDALTISMARSADDPVMLYHASQAIAAGVLSNTLFKMAVALTLGRGAVRKLVPLGLLLSAAASVAMLLILR
ncbi:MAG TPA: DUF4010 domain-containing protein [Candidatus Limnocylindrales bacterium]|nr:DUF4010 domain-containing protein [Candidatus Limnocylindrales bacterium]